MTLTSLALVMALSLPSLGQPLPSVTAHGTDGRLLDLRQMAGKTLLLIYEDRDSMAVNAELKDMLEDQERSGARRPDAVVHAVADVSAFGGAPLRMIVSRAVRLVEQASGRRVYLDWDGSFGRALGVKKGTSSVVLIGPDQKVMAVHGGRVSHAMAVTLVQALARQ